MDIKNVKELVDMMDGTDISILEVTEGDMKIRLEKGTTVANVTNVTKPELIVKSESKPVESKGVIENINSKFEVRSPMVGVFYKASAPDAEPFVKVGSKVKKGDVLCIIEAMKLMNEIYAEQDGTITEVCISDGEVAEYSQVLFRMN